MKHFVNQRMSFILYEIYICLIEINVVCCVGRVEIQIEI